jgi:hypothetical protein
MKTNESPAGYGFLRRPLDFLIRRRRLFLSVLGTLILLLAGLVYVVATQKPGRIRTLSEEPGLAASPTPEGSETTVSALPDEPARPPEPPPAQLGLNPPDENCHEGDIVATDWRSDKAVYARGEPVVLEVEFTNTSGRACSTQNFEDPPYVGISDPEHRFFWSNKLTPPLYQTPQFPSRVWQAGESRRHKEVWPQESYDAESDSRTRKVPAGWYQAIAKSEFGHDHICPGCFPYRWAPEATPVFFEIREGDSAIARPPFPDDRKPTQTVCRSQDLEVVRWELSKGAYSRGDLIEGYAELRNSSGRSCLYGHFSEYQEVFVLTTTDGHRIWSSNDCVSRMAETHWDQLEWSAGVTRGFHLGWDQKFQCTPPEQPQALEPGTYQLRSSVSIEWTQPSAYHFYYFDSAYSRPLIFQTEGG